MSLLAIQSSAGKRRYTLPTDITTAPPAEGEPIGYSRLPDGTTVAGEATQFQESTLQAQFDALHGPPQSPADYQINYVDENGQPIELDAEGRQFDTTVRDLAHTAGLPIYAVEHLAEVLSKPGAIQSSESAEASLRQEWSTAFDKNMGIISEYLETRFGDRLPAVLDFLERSKLGDSPDVIKWILNVATKSHARVGRK